MAENVTRLTCSRSIYIQPTPTHSAVSSPAIQFIVIQLLNIVLSTNPLGALGRRRAREMPRREMKGEDQR